jgi:hypothetical protein
MDAMTSIHPNLAFLLRQVVQFMENLGFVHWIIVQNPSFVTYKLSKIWESNRMVKAQIKVC